MTYHEVKENLCMYDIRNPLYLCQECFLHKCKHKQKSRDKNNCCCDNCFYGRNRLAEALVCLIELTNPLIKEISNY